MKRFCIALVAVLALVSLPVLAVGAPVVFSVSPGELLQSAHVGLDMQTFVPYVGLDIAGAHGKATYDRTYYSYDFTNSRYYRDEVSHQEMEGSATLIVPHIGARMYFGAGKDVKPYVFAELMKSMAFVKGTSTSQSTYYNAAGAVTGTDESSQKLDGAQKDMITDLMGFWGINVGFGGEYAFSERFGVTGEYVLRYLGTGTKQSESKAATATSSPTNWSDDLSGTLKMTGGRFGMVYRF